jgi:hypothetical protein
MAQPVNKPKMCIACGKNPRSESVRLCAACLPVWRKIKYERPSEGEKNRIRSIVGRDVYFKLVGLEATHIMAKNGAKSSGNLIGVA